MTCDGSIPLPSAIGLGIRVAQTSKFKNRLLTFHSTPSWIRFDTNDTFCKKVTTIRNSSWGMSTDLYKVMKLILNTIIENDIPPEEVSNMILAFFTDMQFNAGASNDKSISESIRVMYHSAGLKSRYRVPFTPPHMLWWNLRTTDGFPDISTSGNTTMLSGYSDSLLNAFFDKGAEALKDYSPRALLYEILDKDRYLPLENEFSK